MPKDIRSSLVDRCRPSPYSCANDRRSKSSTLPIGDENEWEQVRCPVCMEHPHNAVLLLCSSREKGCRPYMCDTSSRHSNCLDQFRKSIMNADTPEEDGEGEQTKLVCPLCRGQISGWTIIEPARHFMDSKTRSCSLEMCNFAGNYSELRKHARHEHPRVRPTDVDPQRELEWTSLEEEREQLEMFNMQFEFDDDEALDHDFDFSQFLDGVYELPGPVWDGDYDLEFQFLESAFPELDWDLGNISEPVEDLENYFLDSMSSQFELESPESGSSRISSRSQNRRLSRPRSNTAANMRGSNSISQLSRQRANNPTTTRRGSNDRSQFVRPRANNLATRRGRTAASRRTGTQRYPSSRRHPRSHSRQEQITTLVDFHALRSNQP